MRWWINWVRRRIYLDFYYYLRKEIKKRASKQIDLRINREKTLKMSVRLMKKVLKEKEEAAQEDNNNNNESDTESPSPPHAIINRFDLLLNDDDADDDDQVCFCLFGMHNHHH